MARDIGAERLAHLPLLGSGSTWCFPKEERERLEAGLSQGQGDTMAGSLSLMVNVNSGCLGDLSNREC